MTYELGHHRRLLGPVGLTLVLATVLVLVGIIAYGIVDEPNRARRILEERGYSNITILPSRTFDDACGRSRGVAPRFTATGPDGMPATGIVCTSIMFPGVERRYD